MALPASHMRRKKMKFFVDTANVEEIKKANDMGIICGVTTNPSLIAKEGRDFVEGLKAVKVLNAEGVKTNVTLVFSAAQALLAARAGASYVSPFLGRLDDISMPGIDLIYEITEIFQMHDIETEIIAASIRNPIHVIDCAKAGADIATVPYKVLEQMTKHPLTDQGIAKFQADYKAVFGE